MLNDIANEVIMSKKRAHPRSVVDSIYVIVLLILFVNVTHTHTIFLFKFTPTHEYKYVCTLYQY